MEIINHVLRELGVKRTYQGYHHLASAIKLVIDNEERLLYIHKWLYQEIATLHKTTPFCVERNIRTVKTHCWKTGNRELLEKIAGRPLKEMPSNSEFIDILSCYIVEHYM